MFKKLILLGFFASFGAKIAYAQCTTTPVQETIRNGDFEAGYLSGTGIVHDFTPGGTFDFYSDMNFAGNPPASSATPCRWDHGDKYAVVRAETFTCGTSNNYTNKPYWGIDYAGVGNDITDHTPGLGGKGYSLFVDLNSKIVSPLTGGKPIAWSQTVDIVPGQNYYFSAWMANYSCGGCSPPVLQVTIVPYRQSDGLADPPVTLAAIGAPSGVLNWSQIYSIWTPTGVYNKATVRLEFVNTANGGSGLDVLIDDISFINSCQYLTGNTVPEFGYDTISVCGAAGGNINLNANYPALAATNATFTWFSGSGATQTLIAGVTGQTYSTNTPGTYRVCVQDPDNGCSVNDVVVITSTMTTSLPTATLCIPAAVSLNATPSPSTGSPISYAWTVPAGATNPGNVSTATANVGGTYSVTVTGPNYNGGTCTASASTNILSSLPPVPTNLTYCNGGGTTTALTIGDGKPYYWFTNAAGTTPVNGTIAASTGVSVNWTPPLGTTGDQTFYVVNAQTVPLATLNNASWSWETQPNAMTMTITQPVFLTSVQVQVAGWVGATTSVTVNLTGAQTLNVTQTISTGSSQTVNLNWLLTPGTYQINYTKGGAFLKDFITNGTAAGVTLSGTNVGFINMVFQSSLACAPVPVVVKGIACCVPATVNTNPTNQTTCVNVASPAFSVVATGTALTYQWQESTDGGTTWTNISGQTGSTLSVTPTATTWTGRRYRAIVYTSGTCPTYTTGATLTVNAATSISTQPTASTSICAGTAFNLSVTAAGTGPFTYQWRKDGTDILGATSATFSISSTVIADAGTYTVRVTGTCGSATSNNAVLNVNGVAITTQPTNQGTCTGGNVTFSAVTSGVATITYQWQLSTNSGSTWADIAGATSSTYTVSSATLAMNGYQYRVVVKSNNACAVNSSAATLSVNASTTINTQPQTTSICAPAALNLTVSASGSGVVTYQWYKGGLPIVGATGATYTVASTSSTDAGSYTVDATSACGTTPSAAAVVSVNQSGITTQPVATNTCAAGNASFSVVASGIATLSYQWEVSSNGGTTWTPIASSNATTLNLTGVTALMNNNQYHVIVKSNNLCPTTSSAALLTVNSSTNITTQPASVTVCEPAAVNLAVAATGSGTITYQWKKGGVSIGGATSSSYSIPSTVVTDAGNYTVDVTSNCGTTTSTIAVVTVQTAASAALTVTGGEVCKGSNGSVVVQSSQLGVSYQAFVGATSVSAAVPGTGSNLTIPVNATGLSAGNNIITVKATGCNTVNLPTTTILVLDNPSAISGNTSVCNNAKNGISYSIPAVLGASTYSWTASNGSTIASGQGTNSITVNLGSGNSVLSVLPATANGLTCSSSTLSVTILADYLGGESLSASASNICSNNIVTFTVNNPTADAYTTWIVPAGATIQSTTATSAVVLFGTTGGQISVQPMHACSTGIAPLTNTVTVVPAPVANAGTDIQLDEIKSFTLDGSLSSQNSAYVYNWTSSDPTSVIGNSTALVTSTTPNALETVYALTISVPGLPNCSSTDQVNVKVHFEVQVPNAFSPNDDGVHDFFVVKNSNYFVNAEITIYNQWGEVVYKTNDVYNNPWDGKRNNKDAPVSAYYYVLKLNQSGYDDLSGEINLLR